MLCAVPSWAALPSSLVALFCWGSYSNTFKLADVRFELYYWDYMLGNLLGALALSGREALVGFWGPQLDPWSLVLAASSACLYTLGSVLLTASVEIVGIVATFPVVVGIEMVAGSTGLWLLDRKEKPALLFGGLGLVLAAVLLDTLAHRELELALEAEEAPQTRNTQIEMEPPLGGPQDALDFDAGTAVSDDPASSASGAGSTEKPAVVGHPLGSSPLVAAKPAAPYSAIPHRARDLAAADKLESERAETNACGPDLCQVTQERDTFVEPSKDHHRHTSPACGAAIAISSGVLFAVWPILASGATHRGLPVCTFFLVFNAAAGLSTCAILPALMARPLVGGESLTCTEYRQLPLRVHLLGLLGGIMWSTGAMCSLVASKHEGLAVAMAISRCSPMVAAFWGLLYWNEGRLATPRVWTYIAGMLVFYLCAIVMLYMSAVGR